MLQRVVLDYDSIMLHSSVAVVFFFFKLACATRDKVSSEWRLFLKMNFVTCRSTYHSSCYRIESRTSKNSDELRACIEKAYVVVLNLQCV